ncbi:MAG: AAA family ATPase, partial [Gammaproteobacteria bacterium]|nr:AAA family ATPase [Gammaproteobacteria bacterium]
LLMQYNHIVIGFLPDTTYHLTVDEKNGVPQVVRESLSWKRGSYGAPFRFLDYHLGQGQAASGEAPDAEDQRVEISLKSPDLLAVNALGQFQDHPRVAALRDFILGWHVSCLSVESTRGQPEVGPHERLTRTGDNLANVIQYLAEQHPQQLEKIFAALRECIPRIERVLAKPMQDGRLLLQIKDVPFDHPVLARFASDGTLKMLAYLVLLHDPRPPPFIGIEEPENFLHPHLLQGLAEECRQACGRTQLFVTTHSPLFIDALRPKEVRILWREESGHTKAQCVSEIEGIPEFVETGAHLGDLWMENQFRRGDPLTNQGALTDRVESGSP